MPDSQEPSVSGNPIVRHQPRETQWTAPISQDGKAISKIEDHIRTRIGKVDVVWHEIISDVVHVDVHHVPPSPERDFHTLITTGMSDRPMNVPPRVDDFRYAELMIYLPASWPCRLDLGSAPELSDERNYWPIRWLKMLARLPHEYNTWLGYGHSVPNGDPPKSYAQDTDLCCMLVVPPVIEPVGFTPLVVNVKKKVHFWALLPIYREEMELKLREGTNVLLDRLEEADVDPIVAPQRPNVCAGGSGQA
jgi:hypothetical protein